MLSSFITQWYMHDILVLFCLYRINIGFARRPIWWILGCILLYAIEGGFVLLMKAFLISSTHWQLPMVVPQEGYSRQNENKIDREINNGARKIWSKSTIPRPSKIKCTPDMLFDVYSIGSFLFHCIDMLISSYLFLLYFLLWIAYCVLREGHSNTKMAWYYSFCCI